MDDIDDDTGERSEVNKRTKLYLVALKRLQRQLPGKWIVTYPEEGNPNSVIFLKCPMGGLNEVSSMAGGAVQGFAGPFTKEEKKIIQEMYSSAAIMGSGSGRIPAERSPEAHRRYVRIRFKRQGLQNFKPNRYFSSKDQQLGEKKNKKGASKSYCESTPCKDMGFTQKASCKSQGIKDCYRGKKKN